MYTPQQTAKPLSAYDSYIQQNLATREALRVRPHGHTPKNEPLPPTAGLEGVVHDIPTQEPDVPIPPTVAAKPNAAKQAGHMPRYTMPRVTQTIGILENTIAVAPCVTTIAGKAGPVVPFKQHTGAGCRGGPV